MTPDTFQQVLRWSLLAAFALCLAFGIGILVATGTEADEQWAAFALVLLSGVCLGAFLRDRDTRDE